MPSARTQQREKPPEEPWKVRGQQQFLAFFMGSNDGAPLGVFLRKMLAVPEVGGSILKLSDSFDAES